MPATPSFVKVTKSNWYHKHIRVNTHLAVLILVSSLTLFTKATAQTSPPHTHPQLGTVATLIDQQLKPTLSQFPDYSSNYQKMIAAESACKTAGGVFSSGGCAIPPPPPPPPPAPKPTYIPPVVYGLMGQVGWSLTGGNCVNMAIAYGKDQPGNPISWYITTTRPFIGAAALFYFNHVAIVTGIWGNGDIEVAQENAPGMPHRLPLSEFRGFF